MQSDIAQRFASARQRAADAVRAGGNGIEVSRDLSREVDAIVVEAAGREVAKCKTPVAVFATGGFGRAELAPYSDLDLLVLCAKTPGTRFARTPRPCRCRRAIWRRRPRCSTRAF